MVRYTGPKNRIARRFGANIFGRARNPMLHKPNPPGVHGARRKKKSDYGQQLDEQQKLKAVFGMLTLKQLLKYYKKADNRKGNTANELLTQLESRLDNIVYRLKLAPTIFAAQQMIAHGHVLVDGKKVDIRSFEVKPGMTVSLKQKAQNMEVIKLSIENASREVPEYLVLDPKAFSGKMEAAPQADQVSLPLPINVPLVCEFLAHTH